MRAYAESELDPLSQIELASYEHPWDRGVFEQVLGSQFHFCELALIDKMIVGYIVYSISSTDLEILNLTVHPNYRRHGIGSEMLSILLWTRLNRQRNRMVAPVRERNLAAQLFLKQMGFFCVDTLREYYIDCYKNEKVSENAYLFEYVTNPVHAQEIAPWVGFEEAA